MNLILFSPEEIERPLPKSDPRARHVLKVLRRKLGDTFDVGLINGPKGKGTLEEVGETAIRLTFSWGAEEPSLYPIDLIVGLSRPQTNRKILNEATTLGARSIRFVTTERGEPSYAESKLWTTGEWRRHLIAGAEQAFATRIPEVSFGISLEEAVEKLGVNPERFALDNYEATERFGIPGNACSAMALAIGSERGWTEGERNLLRNNGYKLASLGERVLRTETAVVVALGLSIARLR